MCTFSNTQITIASIDDATAIKELLNSAYRGETSKKGWTTEADIIAGETRTDTKMLIETMQQTGSIFLKYTDAEQRIAGCVNLQQHQHKLYLGMFSVSPELQGNGIGKQILKAAEEYAACLHCTSIYMSVISVRTELIEWYKRKGFIETGEKKFFEENSITGRHLQPLEFIFLEKSI